MNVLVFVAVGGAAGAGIVALANAISTHQPPQAADLRELTAYPVTAGLKTDRLPMIHAAGTATDAAPPSTATLSPVSQYTALAPVSSSAAALNRDALDNKPSNSNLSNNKPFDSSLFEEPPPATIDEPSMSAKSKAAQVAVQAKPEVKPAKPSNTNAVLNDAQIAHLKERLKLTPAQQQYWPEIEAALRGVVKQIYEANKKARGAIVPLDTKTPEVERLTAAAIPLLMRLRPDQKAEIITLARIIGMEKMIAAL